MRSPSSTDQARARPYLGTLVTVRAGGDSGDHVRRAIDEAFRRIAGVHSLMSFHDASSEVSTLNRLAHRRAVVVSPETFSVLTLASEIFLASAGTFDITVA